MTVFVDASAIVAILAREEDGRQFAARAKSVEDPRVSGLVIFEAAVALARRRAMPGRKPTVSMVARAREAVAEFLIELKAKEILIDSAIAHEAIGAAMIYGKIVNHPADLNMGDCFAYACARSVGAALLFKGDDFLRTDIVSA